MESIMRAMEGTIAIGLFFLWLRLISIGRDLSDISSSLSDIARTIERIKEQHGF